MAKYRFSHWEDGSTSPSRAITVTGDITITAYYELVVVKRRVRFESTPIAVTATIDTTSIPSGSTVREVLSFVVNILQG